ncbi:MAG TPA: hypothetical protein P5107_03685 [Thermotogota bacterium]|nr:hypothetical protein [Thermotogota bacterium]
MTGKLRDRYTQKLTEFKTLDSLAVYDIRADMYAQLEACTTTIHAFKEAVTINKNKIYLDKEGEMSIQKGESYSDKGVAKK